MIAHRTARGLPTQDEPRKDDRSIPQSKQQKEVSHDPVQLEALLQMKSTPLSPQLAHLPRATTFNSITSHDSGFWSAQASQESLDWSLSARPKKRSSGLKSVHTASIQDSIDANQPIRQEHQQLNTQQLHPATMLFAQHRMFPFLTWLEQHVSYPFPQEEEVEKLAKLAQLTVPEARKWLTVAQGKLFQHARQIEAPGQLFILQNSKFEQRVPSNPVFAPSRVSANSSKARTGLLVSRSRRLWYRMSSPTSKVTSIGHAVASIPTAFVFPLSTGEPAERISTLKPIQSNPELPPKSTKLLRLDRKNSLSTGQKRVGSTATSENTADYQSVAPIDKCDDPGTWIDRWVAELVNAHSEEIRANMRRWHVMSNVGPTCDPTSKPTIELPSICDSISSDDIPETDFHSLQLGERSPSYHVGAGGIREQDTGKQKTDPEIDINFLSLYDAQPADQIDSAISDTTSCSSEIDQMDLWSSEQETFVEWAKDHIIPFLIEDFKRNIIHLSFSDTDSSVRTCPSGEASRGQQHAAVRRSTSNPFGKGSGGKRKRSKSDEDGKPSKEPDPGARESDKSSGDASNDKLWACPYYKYDAYTYSSVNTKYKSCPTGYTGMNRLKSHLKRVHTPEYYCDRCKTVFKGAEERHAHDNSEERCAEVLLCQQYRDMIIGPKKEALKKKQVGETYEHEWYRIWELLFSSCPPPASPYQELNREMRSFRERAEGLRHIIIQNFREHLPAQLQHIPVDVLINFYRFAIETLAIDNEPSIVAAAQAQNDTPRPSAIGAVTGTNAPLAMPEPQSAAPWNASVQHPRGMPAQQAIADANATFPAHSYQQTVPPTFDHDLAVRMNGQTDTYMHENSISSEFSFDTDTSEWKLPGLTPPSHGFDDGSQYQ